MKYRHEHNTAILRQSPPGSWRALCWGAQGRVATSEYLKEKAEKYPAYFDGGRLDMMLSRVEADPTLEAWDCSGLVNWALEEIGAVKSGFDTTVLACLPTTATSWPYLSFSGELQKTIVEKLKAAGGGKLTEAQITELGELLKAKTLQKLYA